MYELSYIASPDLNEEELAKLAEDVRGLVAKAEGEIKTEKIGEKRKLSSPINKKLFGFLISLDFTIKEAQELATLKDSLAKKKSILRLLVIEKPEKFQSEIRPTPPKLAPKPKTEKAAQPKIEVTPEEQEKKLEEIDKKLDEIINE